MGVRNDLENDLSMIWDITISVKENFSYSRYLHQPDNIEEVKYIQNSNDFMYFRHVLWRMCIIDLSKLYSDKPERDRYCLTHLFKKLSCDGHYRSIEFDKLKLVEWDNFILSNNDVIKNVLRLRDKIYAHTDRNKNELKIEISFIDVEPLIVFVEVVLKEIFSSVFDTYADIEHLYFDKERFNMVKILAKSKKDKLDKEIEDFISENNSKNVNLSGLT